MTKRELNTICTPAKIMSATSNQMIQIIFS